MARIVFRSFAGLADVIAVVMFAANQSMDAPSARAQSARVGDPSAASNGAGGAVQAAAVNPTVEDLSRVIAQPAHIDAYERADIFAKASGFVSKVLVDIGDQVEQDQILAELWIPEMEQEERQ